MTPSQRMGVSVVVIAVSLGVPTARAAPLQLIGELSVTNPTGGTGAIAGGLEFTLSVLDPDAFLDSRLLGQTVLAPAFWPEPGQTFTGSFAVDFVTPGPGLVETDPLRVDGITPYLDLIASVEFLDPIWRTLSARFPLTELGIPVRSDLYIGPVRDPPPLIVGEATFRVDTIVPEPAGGVMALLLAMTGIGRRRWAAAGTGTRTRSVRSHEGGVT